MPMIKTTIGNSGWQTPQSIFDSYALEFGPFDLDPASAHTAYTSTQVEYYCTEEGTFEKGGAKISDEDGLAISWSGRVWLNPPYKRVEPWIAKAVESVQTHEIDCIVMLLMPSIDSKWFHRFLWDSISHQPRPGIHLRFLQGRIRFVHPDPEQRKTAFKGFRPISGNMIVVMENPTTPDD